MAFNSASHPRAAKGTPGGGRFVRRKKKGANLQHMGSQLRQDVRSGKISAAKARTIHQTRVKRQQRRVTKAVGSSTQGVTKANRARVRKAVSRRARRRK